MKLLGDRLLIKRIKEQEQINGIYIPDSAQKHTNKAKVIIIGPEMPEDIKVGITIVSDAFEDTIDIDGEIYYIIREDNVVAIMEE